MNNPIVVNKLETKEEEKEIARLVGEVIFSWSKIERELFWLFVRASGQNVSQPIWKTFTQLSTQLRMLSTIIKLMVKDDKQHLKFWNTLHKKIENFKAKRARVAHSELVRIKSDDEIECVIVPYFSSKNMGNDSEKMTKHDIRKLLIEFEDLYFVIRWFSETVSNQNNFSDMMQKVQQAKSPQSGSHLLHEMLRTL